MTEQAQGVDAELMKVLYTMPSGTAALGRVWFPLGKMLPAVETKRARRFSEDGSSPWHGAPAGQAVIVTVHKGTLAFYIDDGSGGELEIKLEAGESLICQDDGNAATARAELKAGHRSQVQGKAEVLMTAIVLAQRFEDIISAA